MTTPNLDALAKLGPFHFVEEQNCGWFAGEEATIINEPDIAAALNEWAELRATVAELRRWRSEHDCRYTLGAVADLDGVHCPIDNPCVRCQRRLDGDAAQKENAELRAYRERTEAVKASLRENADAHQMEWLRANGLWRDPAPKEAT